MLSETEQKRSKPPGRATPRPGQNVSPMMGFRGDPPFSDAPDSCRSRSEVIARYRHRMEAGAHVTVEETLPSATAVVPGPVIARPPASSRTPTALRYQVCGFEEDVVPQIVGADDRPSRAEMLHARASR